MDRKVIGIYGVPRTGTSWLGELFNSSPEVIYKYQPQFSYKYRGKIREDSTYKELKDCFEEMVFASDDFVDQVNERGSGKLPRFEPKEISDSSILVYKEARFIYTIENIIQQYPQFKLIAIVRNPVDTLNSWINAPKEFDKSWDINVEWKKAHLKNKGLKENFYGYDKWKEAVNYFLYLKDTYSDRVRVIKYEDLCRNTEEELTQLFDYCNIKFSSSTRDFIQKSQGYTNNDPYSVYRNKGIKREYKKHLDTKIVNEIETDLIYNKKIKSIWVPAD